MPTRLFDFLYFSKLNVDPSNIVSMVIQYLSSFQTGVSIPEQIITCNCIFQERSETGTLSAFNAEENLHL